MSIREEQCNKVCRTLDDVLANRPTERDSLIIAVRKAFESLEQLGNSERLPSAQPEPIKINIEDFNKEDWERLKKEWGNTPITVLPAQPEIIRCKDCKYAEVADKEDGQDGYTCQFHRGSIWFSGSYCSWAERRQNE